MPRYFFHARGPNSYVVDHEGVALTSVEAARETALRIIRDTAAEAAELAGGGEWTVLVTDEDGRIVLTIPFSEALKPGGGWA
jgi:hypothetical protein